MVVVVPCNRSTTRGSFIDETDHIWMRSPWSQYHASILLLGSCLHLFIHSYFRKFSTWCNYKFTCLLLTWLVWWLIRLIIYFNVWKQHGCRIPLPSCQSETLTTYRHLTAIIEQTVMQGKSLIKLVIYSNLRRYNCSDRWKRLVWPI